MKQAIIGVRRVYDAPRSDDGDRYLIDRFWPRAVKKKDLRITAWLKEVAPRNDLRRWFGHDPAKWEECQRRYFAELDGKAEALAPIREASQRGRVTLVYAARDTEHNNAVALKRYLEG
jgi:uncharacterized protein YeaO (DUF488 family)